MKKGINTYKKYQIYIWLLYLIFFTLPLYDYSWSSKMLLVWALYGLFFMYPLPQTWEHIKRKWDKILNLSIPFLLVVIGTTYGYPKEEIVFCWQKKIPFLLIPAVLAIHPPTIRQINKAMEWFIAGILTASFIALMEAIYIYFQSGASYFFFDKLAQLLNKHTTYFALFLVVSLLFVWYNFLKEECGKWMTWSLSVVFLGMLYLLSARISLLALIIGGVYLLWKLKIKGKKKQGIFLILVGLFILVLSYQTPAFQRRFKPIFWKYSSEQFYLPRWMVMKSAWQYYRQSPSLIGHGTAAHRDEWLAIYRKNHLDTAAREHYNAHNQWLETMIYHGILGEMAIIWMVVWAGRIIFKKSYVWMHAVFVVFLIFMITESIWQRQNGIFLWSLLISMFIMVNSEKNGTKE